MMYHSLPKLVWKKEEIPPFNELIFSWNAFRPSNGRHLFYLSVKTNDWSPWLLYASWGSSDQSSFQNKVGSFPLKIYQDTLELLDGHRATGFQIKIVLDGNADINQIYGLHVYTNSDREEGEKQFLTHFDKLQIPMTGLSQMTLDHPRFKDLCSPTSTAAVVQYLANKQKIDPIQFAQQAWDKGFDIFGNWVLNIAEASNYLGLAWNCWVERLSSFVDIQNHLSQKTPVIVSVRGPLVGSAQPYAKGHLIVVTGYHLSKQKVICMDPAFPSDSQTIVEYDLSDFLQAWKRRGNLAYVFSPQKNNQIA